MIILKHRVLTIEEIDPNYGIEIDVRDFNNELVVSHDLATNKSPKLDKFLEQISSNQLLAINVKSVEIENQLKQILHDCGLTNYFTFDWPIPSLLKAINTKLKTAFRLSEYETDIYNNCEWVWLDSFDRIWYDVMFIESLKKQGFKIAIVSPELHKREKDLKKIKDIVNYVMVDAICTDYPQYWNK